MLPLFFFSPLRCFDTLIFRYYDLLFAIIFADA